MAPLPVIANVYRCAFNWAASSQSAENVIHILAPASNSGAVFDALDGALQEDQFLSVSATAFVESVSIIPLDGHSATTTVATTNPLWTGGTDGNWSPAVATIIRLGTGVRGRSFRGRVFLPFTADTAQTDGSVTGSIVASMNDAWAAFLGALGEGFTWVVASYKLEEASAVLYPTVQTACATQRRRQTRVIRG